MTFFTLSLVSVIIFRRKCFIANGHASWFTVSLVGFEIAFCSKCTKMVVWWPEMAKRCVSKRKRGRESERVSDVTEQGPRVHVLVDPCWYTNTCVRCCFSVDDSHDGWAAQASFDASLINPVVCDQHHPTSSSSPLFTNLTSLSLIYTKACNCLPTPERTHFSIYF